MFCSLLRNGCLCALMLTACSSSDSEGSSASNDGGGTPAADCTPLPLVEMSGAVTASCNEEDLRAKVAAGGKIKIQDGCTSLTVTKEIVVEKSGTVIDANGATLKGGGNNRILAGRYKVDFTLQRATVRGGVGKKNGNVRPDSSDGGAIEGNNESTLTIIDSIFEDNRSEGTGDEDGGGAIVKQSKGLLRISGSTFRRNSGKNGGAVKNLLSNLDVRASTFEDNIGTDGKNGGGALIVDGSDDGPKKASGFVRICGSVFRKNIMRLGQGTSGANGRGSGGAAFLYVYPDAGKVSVTGTVFDGNQAAGHGGGLHFGYTSGSSLSGSSPPLITLTSVVFTNNRAQAGGGARFFLGGNASASLTNVVAVDNCAGRSGAECAGSESDGSFSGGGIAAFEGSVAVDRSTFSRNRAAAYGGGMSAPLTAFTRSLAIENTSGNPYKAGPNCQSKAKAGADSIEWPAVSGSSNGDQGCGASTAARAVAVTKAPGTCSTRVGSPAASELYPDYSVTGSPGAACP